MNEKICQWLAAINEGHGKDLSKVTCQTQFYSAGSDSAVLTVLLRFMVEEQDIELSFRH